MDNCRKVKNSDNSYRFHNFTADNISIIFVNLKNVKHRLKYSNFLKTLTINGAQRVVNMLEIVIISDPLLVWGQENENMTSPFMSTIIKVN